MILDCLAYFEFLKIKHFLKAFLLKHLNSVCQIIEMTVKLCQFSVKRLRIAQCPTFSTGSLKIRVQSHCPRRRENFRPCIVCLLSFQGCENMAGCICSYCLKVTLPYFLFSASQINIEQKASTHPPTCQMMYFTLSVAIRSCTGRSFLKNSAPFCLGGMWTTPKLLYTEWLV